MHRSTQEGQGPWDASESGEYGDYVAAELLSDVKNLKKRHV
jgi:hypothetical protein